MYTTLISYLRLIIKLIKIIKWGTYVGNKKEKKNKKY